MEIHVIRYRATRRSVIGILHVGDFECFTLERRTDMLEVGHHQIIDGKHLMVGDHPITDRTRKDGFDGAIMLGLTAERHNLRETGAAYHQFLRAIRPAIDIGEPINVEVIDEIDYHATDLETL